MNTTSFTFNPRMPYWPFLAGGFLFVGFALFIIDKLFSPGTKVVSFAIALAIILLFGIIGVLLLISCLHRIQYVRIDKNKTLLLNKTNRQLQITCNNKTYTINNADIKNVEIYYSWNSKAILPGYMKLHLLNSDFFIITGFLANEFDLQALLKGKKRVTKRRVMNSISRNTIKNSIC